MDIRELTLQVATAIEGIAATDRQLAGLSSSLMAMRLALAEVSPERFEKAYAKHFSGPGCEKVRQTLQADAQALLAAAEALRRSA